MYCAGRIDIVVAKCEDVEEFYFGDLEYQGYVVPFLVPKLV